MTTEKQLLDLAERVEEDLRASPRFMMLKAWKVIGGSAGYASFVRLLDAKAFESAAVMLVPKGHSYAAGDLGEHDIPWACVTSPLDADADGGCKDFTANAGFAASALTAACLRARAAERREG